MAGGLNLYGFAGGDPVNFSDPFGLRHCCERGQASYKSGTVPTRSWDLELFAFSAANGLNAHVRISSGDRDYVPRGGSGSSEHLVPSMNPAAQGAIDFNLFGEDGSKIPGSAVVGKILEWADFFGVRVVWHDEGTATVAPHFHADFRVDQGHQYESGDHDGDGKPDYSPLKREDRE